jgi:hypothetical protein
MDRFSFDCTPTKHGCTQNMPNASNFKQRKQKFEQRKQKFDSDNKELHSRWGACHDLVVSFFGCDNCVAL